MNVVISRIRSNTVVNDGYVKLIVKLKANYIRYYKSRENTVIREGIVDKRKEMVDNATGSFKNGNISDDNFTEEELFALNAFKDYPPDLLNFAAVCCVLFMMVGIPGNLITIISLARYKKVRNATAIFIINLSCSDLLFCCINLPLAASTFWTRSWHLGVFMCRFFPFARFALAGVSVFTILAITVNRYIMVSHPHIYSKLFTPRTLACIIASTWIVAITMLTPTWAEVWGRFGMKRETTFCVIIPDESGRSPMKLLFLCAFFVPFLTTSICYARIFYIVRKSNSKVQGNKRQYLPDKDELSFATSSGERSPDCESANHHHILPPEHPRVTSLRPPSSPGVTTLITQEQRSKSTGSNILNFGKTFNLRKSQFLDKAAPTSKDKRLLTMITAIMITFFICYTPITVIQVFMEVTEQSPTAIIWSYLLRYLTTCVNPVIYVAMSQEYRKAYKKVIVLRSCRSQTCDFWR